MGIWVDESSIRPYIVQVFGIHNDKARNSATRDLIVRLHAGVVNYSALNKIS